MRHTLFISYLQGTPGSLRLEETMRSEEGGVYWVPSACDSTRRGVEKAHQRLHLGDDLVELSLGLLVLLDCFLVGISW